MEGHFYALECYFAAYLASTYYCPSNPSQDMTVKNNWYCQISPRGQNCPQLGNWGIVIYDMYLRSCLPSSLASWVTVTKKFWSHYVSQGGGPLRSLFQREPSGRSLSCHSSQADAMLFSQLMIQHNGNTRAGPFSAQNGTSQICNIYSSFPWPGWSFLRVAL